jgi:7-cyano-7-deazaguanine synthase
MNQVKTVSYTQRLNKTDIVNLGLRLAVPLQYLWSCYRGGGKMCGRCESCQRLRRAAQGAGLDHNFFSFE